VHEVLFLKILRYELSADGPLPNSVAEVQFSPVLPPFLENQELNREFWAATELNQNRTGLEPVLPVLFCSVLGSN